MNKTSAIFAAIGIVVLVGVGYIAFKPKAQTNTPVTNGSNTVSPTATPNGISEPPVPEVPKPVEAIFEYKKGAAYTEQALKVQEGQQVILKVTADVADEAHLHAYDISKEFEPNQQVTLEFTATKTGRFELELEKLKKTLGYIEVYPK